jgi:hypothetical protein
MQDTFAGAAKRPRLTPLQSDQFLRTGMLRAPGLVPPAAVNAMTDRLWDELERRWRILRDRPETWIAGSPTHLQGPKRAGAFAAMASPGLRALLDEMYAGRGWTGPSHWGQALVTFPGPAGWTVPHAAWHIDLAYWEDLAPWPGSLRIFVLLAPLAPGGGGTVYVSGSHRLAMRVAEGDERPLRTAGLKDAVSLRSPWLEALRSAASDDDRIARFMRTGATVDGIELRVVEMTGEPGDVFLMHPGVLHAAAPNASRTPRLMLAETVRARTTPS